MSSGCNHVSSGCSGIDSVNLANKYEQTRKKQWISLGVHSEEGRDSQLLGTASSMMDIKGGSRLAHSTSADLLNWLLPDGVTTSVFHPYLAEHFYR